VKGGGVVRDDLICDVILATATFPSKELHEIKIDVRSLLFFS